MSGFCADCGRPVHACACPRNRSGAEVTTAGETAVIELPRASAGRRLAGSGVEYLVYLAGITALAILSFLLVLDLLLVPFLALFIAMRDVSSGRYSIAKRIGNMRVVQFGTGLAATNRQAVLRNSYYVTLATLMALPIVLDTLAATFFYGLVVIDTLMIVGSSDGRRLGDLIAGTQVVHAKAG